jgi:hypothetical protein
MEKKPMTWNRRKLAYGFCPAKDEEGQAMGASIVQLARRNAFELIGLKRPRLAPVPWTRSA